MPKPKHPRAKNTAPKTKPAKPSKISEKDRKTVLDKLTRAVKAVPHPDDQCKFNPSAIKSLRLCPSFYPVFEEEETKVAANEGTLLHEATHNAKTYKSLSTDQKAMVDKCLAYAKHAVPEKARLSSTHEIKVSVMGISNGYIDLTIETNDGKGTLHVFDWKFGKMPVDDAKINDQGKAYALALYEMYFRRNQQINELVVHFVSPRIDEISCHTFNIEDIKAIKEDLTALFLETRKPANKRLHNVTPAACVNCGRLPICPAVRDATLRITREATSKLSDETIDALTSNDPESISDPVMIGALFTLTRPFAELGKRIADHATQLLMSGHAMEGIKLVERAGNSRLSGSVAEIAGLIETTINEGRTKQQKRIPVPPIELADPVGITELEMRVKAIAENYGLDSKEAVGLCARIRETLSKEGYISSGLPSFYPKLA